MPDACESYGDHGGAGEKTGVQCAETGDMRAHMLHFVGNKYHLVSVVRWASPGQPVWLDLSAAGDK
jgi:hypothetical protein